MPAPIYPQFEVVPFVYVVGSNTSTGYLIQMIPYAFPNGQVVSPVMADATVSPLNYPNYAAMITKLTLAAVVNLSDYPYAYVVGAGANNFLTDALAKAAAIADCTKIINQRNTNLAAGGISGTNPFVTLSAPVFGPL